MDNARFEAIKKYKELLDLGIITKEEFETKKRELLEQGNLNPEVNPTQSNGVRVVPPSVDRSESLSQEQPCDNASQIVENEAPLLQEDDSSSQNPSLNTIVPNTDVQKPKSKKKPLIIISLFVILLAIMTPFFISSTKKNNEYAKQIESNFSGLSFSYHQNYGANSYLDIWYTFKTGNTYSSGDKSVFNGSTQYAHNESGTYAVSVFFGKITLTVTDEKNFSQTFTVSVDSLGRPTSIRQGSLTMYRK